MSRLLYITLSLFFLAFIQGCASSEKLDTNSAEGAFALAQRFEKDERYEEAITYYTEVKNKFPYSRLATDSELKIADVEFKRENYVEAESAYKLFREFHPDHEKSDYVIFRLGLSVYNQLPSTSDRDLDLASAALDYFNSVTSRYTKSPYAKEAATYADKIKKLLADKANYIAEFYFIRRKWESALGRYEDLIRSHFGLGYDAKALYGATISAYNLKEMDKAKKYFKQLLSEHPDSSELALVRKELADGF